MFELSSPKDDDLYIPTVGEQSRDKHYFLMRYIDALRNWEHNYLDNPDSNLDRCLGPGTNWRSLLNEAPAQRRAEVLRNLYVDQLKKQLAYTEFEYERISFKGHPLYVLIFCSRSEFAAKLWRGTSQTKLDGQRTFDFDKG